LLTIKILSQEYEGSSLTDIAAAPTSALQGVAQKGRDVLKPLGCFGDSKMKPVETDWCVLRNGWVAGGCWDD